MILLGWRQRAECGAARDRIALDARRVRDGAGAQCGSCRDGRGPARAWRRTDVIRGSDAVIDEHIQCGSCLGHRGGQAV